MTTWYEAEISDVAAAARLREEFEEQCVANGVTVIYLSGQLPTTQPVLAEIWSSMGRRLHRGLELKARVQPDMDEVKITDMPSMPEDVHDLDAMQAYVDAMRQREGVVPSEQ